MHTNLSNQIRQVPKDQDVRSDSVINQNKAYAAIGWYKFTEDQSFPQYKPGIVVNTSC